MYAFECLDELTKSVGPVLVDKKLPEITEAIKSFIEKGHDMEDEEEMEIEEEEEENILESVGELVRRLAKVLREGFLPYLHILGNILKLYSSHYDRTDQTQGRFHGDVSANDWKLSKMFRILTATHNNLWLYISSSTS